jgi:hypothetical protein
MKNTLEATPVRICTYHFDGYMLVVVQVLPCKQKRNRKYYHADFPFKNVHTHTLAHLAKQIIPSAAPGK